MAKRRGEQKQIIFLAIEESLSDLWLKLDRSKRADNSEI